MATPDPHGRPPAGRPPVAGASISRPGRAEPAPAVVAVVVSEGAEHLARCLAALASQDYPALTVLVLDRGSLAGRDSRKERIAAAAPAALVRALDRHPDRATAANDVIATVEGAPFFCFVADDVELEPHAISQLVEEAFRSNAAICGPKIVDRDHAEVLLEVGMATDHYGVAMTGIEPGEIDQEQHDAVRDVFFVSQTVMLVRADLFCELGGFDPKCAPGNEDLDLCWRARLAGARVLVVPDARARRDPRFARRADSMQASFAAAVSTRARTLLKNYSAAALVWVLPVATFLNFLESVGYLFARRPNLARASFTGWWSTVLRSGAIRADRRAAQALRRIDDREVRAFMVRGSARARVLLTRHRHRRTTRVEFAQGWLRTRVLDVRRGMRSPEVMVAAVFALLMVFGARRFLLQSVPSVGGFQRWTSTSDLLGAWGGRWRFAGLGADAAGPSSLGLYGLWSALLLGNVAFAQALIVFGSLPVGLVGMYRLTRRLSERALPASAALIAYGANPLVRNAYAKAELGALVLFAVTPFIAQRCIAIADGVTGAVRRRAIAGTVVLGALASAVAPASALFPALLALAMLLALPLVGGARNTARMAILALCALVAAFVMLWPWSLTTFGGGGTAFGFVPRQSFSLADLLAFRTGPAGSGIWPWFVFPAAALPLLVATEARFAWAVRSWLLAVVSFAFAWLPGWFSADASVPTTEVLLVPAAFGLALAVGLGLGAFVIEIRSFVFGVRQGLAITLGFCALGPMLGAIPDIFDGGFDAPAASWSSSLAFMSGQAKIDGSFRVLWVGAPEALPVDAIAVGDRYAFGVTRSGSGDVRDQFPPAPGSGEDIVVAAIELARDSRTARLGHVLAPMGVRYIALVDRPAPDSAVAGSSDARIEEALSTQLDLRLSRSADGLALYENEAWLSGRALLADELPDAARGDITPLDALAFTTRADLADSATALRGPLRELRVDAPGNVLLAERFGNGWSASIDGELLEHDKTFGWANGFIAPSTGTANLSFDGGSLHLFTIVLPLLIWSAAFGAAVWRPRGAEVVRALSFESIAETAGSTRTRRRPRERADPDAGSGPSGVIPDDGGEESDDDLAALETATPATSEEFDWSVLEHADLDDGDDEA